MTLTVQSMDGILIDITASAAEHSRVIADLVKDLQEINGGSEDAETAQIGTIPLPEVEGCVLRNVVEWCEHHKNDPKEADVDDDPQVRKRTDDISDWDLNFMTVGRDRNFMNVDQDRLFKLTLAANYLDIRPLVNLCCKTLANMIKGNSPEEIREIFGIPNPFTEADEEKIRKENEWIEEPADTALGH